MDIFWNYTSQNMYFQVHYGEHNQLLDIKQFELYPETLKLCSNILTTSSLSGVECLGCPGASTFGKASP